MKKQKIGIIVGVIAALLIAIIAIVSNIHTCEECEKTYIGKEYKITFFDQSETVCKECYNGFYSFN